MPLEKVFLLPPLRGLNLYDNPFTMPPDYATELVNFMPPTTTLTVRPAVKYILEIPGQVKGLLNYTVGATRNHAENWYNSTIEYGAADEILIKTTSIDGRNTLYRVVPLNNSIEKIGEFTNSNYNDDSYLYRHTLFMASGDANSAMTLYHQAKGLKNFALTIGADGNTEIADIVSICGYGKYMYCAQQTGLNVYFVQLQYADILDPINSTWWKSFENLFTAHDGASFSLDGLVTKGGSILKMFNVSRSGADTLSTFLAFITDMGEIVLFQGEGPTVVDSGNKDKGTWQAIGKWQIPPPLNKWAFVEMEGDVIIATRNGLMSLRRVVFGQQTQITENLEYKLRSLFSMYQFQIPAITEFVNLYYHPRERLLIMNVPTDMPMPFNYIVPTYNFNTNKSLIFPADISSSAVEDLRMFCEKFIYYNGVDYSIIVEFNGNYNYDCIFLRIKNVLVIMAGTYKATTYVNFGIKKDGITQNFFKESIIFSCSDLQADYPVAELVSYSPDWDPGLVTITPSGEKIISYKFTGDYTVTNITPEVAKFFVRPSVTTIAEATPHENMANYQQITKYLQYKVSTDIFHETSIKDFFGSQDYLGLNIDYCTLYVGGNANKYTTTYWNYYGDNHFYFNDGLGLSFHKIFVDAVVHSWQENNYDFTGYAARTRITDYFHVGDKWMFTVKFSLNVANTVTWYSIQNIARVVECQIREDEREGHCDFEMSIKVGKEDGTEYYEYIYRFRIYTYVGIYNIQYNNTPEQYIRVMLPDSNSTFTSLNMNGTIDFGGATSVSLEYDGYDIFACSGSGSFKDVILRNLGPRTQGSGAWCNINADGHLTAWNNNTQLLPPARWGNRFNWAVANYVLVETNLPVLRLPEPFPKYALPGPPVNPDPDKWSLGQFYSNDIPDIVLLGYRIYSSTTYVNVTDTSSLDINSFYNSVDMLGPASVVWNANMTYGYFGDQDYRISLFRVLHRAIPIFLDQVRFLDTIQEYGVPISFVFSNRSLADYPYTFWVKFTVSIAALSYVEETNTWDSTFNVTQETWITYEEGIIQEAHVTVSGIFTAIFDVTDPGNTSTGYGTVNITTEHMDFEMNGIIGALANNINLNIDFPQTDSRTDNLLREILQQSFNEKHSWWGSLAYLFAYINFDPTVPLPAPQPAYTVPPDPFPSKSNFFGGYWGGGNYVLRKRSSQTPFTMTSYGISSFYDIAEYFPIKYRDVFSLTSMTKANVINYSQNFEYQWWRNTHYRLSPIALMHRVIPLFCSYVYTYTTFSASGVEHSIEWMQKVITDNDTVYLGVYTYIKLIDIAKNGSDLVANFRVRLVREAETNNSDFAPQYEAIYNANVLFNYTEAVSCSISWNLETINVTSTNNGMTVNVAQDIKTNIRIDIEGPNDSPVDIALKEAIVKYYNITNGWFGSLSYLFSDIQISGADPYQNSEYTPTLVEPILPRAERITPRVVSSNDALTCVTNTDLKQISLLKDINIMCDYRSTQYVFDSHFGTWSSFEGVNMIKALEHGQDYYFVVPQDISYDTTTGKYIYAKSTLCRFESNQLGDYGNTPIEVSYATVNTFDLGAPLKKIFKRLNVFGNPSAFWQPDHAGMQEWPVIFQVTSDFKPGYETPFVHAFDIPISKKILSRHFKSRSLTSLSFSEQKKFWQLYQAENAMIAKINIPVIAQVGTRFGLKMKMKMMEAYCNIYGFEIFFIMAKNIL